MERKDLIRISNLAFFTFSCFKQCRQFTLYVCVLTHLCGRAVQVGSDFNVCKANPSV